jgi:hypothetical protein
MADDSVNRDQHEHGKGGQQNIVEVADDSRQAYNAKKHDQNGCEATQRGNYRADNSHSKKPVVHVDRPLQILVCVCASA